MPEGSSDKPYKSKIELGCELIDAFKPPWRNVVVAFDEWYLCGEVVKHTEDKGFRWVSEAKGNRIIFYDDEKLHVSDLLDKMKPFFRDVEVDGEVYQCMDLEAYMPRIGGVRLLFNCKADTKDLHHLCTSIKNLSTMDMLRKGFERAKIESFHWDIKNTLGFGEYRFRESEAAMIHSHLVLLAYTLLLILKKKLEKKKPEKIYSIGEACRWGRDRCLVSIARWFQDRFSAGLSLTKIIGMIRPQIYK